MTLDQQRPHTVEAVVVVVVVVAVCTRNSQVSSHQHCKQMYMSRDQPSHKSCGFHRRMLRPQRNTQYSRHPTPSCHSCPNTVVVAQ